MENAVDCVSIISTLHSVPINLSLEHLYIYLLLVLLKAEETAQYLNEIDAGLYIKHFQEYIILSMINLKIYVCVCVCVCVCVSDCVWVCVCLFVRVCLLIFYICIYSYSLDETLFFF